MEGRLGPPGLSSSFPRAWGVSTDAKPDDPAQPLSYVALALVPVCKWGNSSNPRL